MGDGEGTEEGREGRSASTPREVPSNFSAVVTPVPEEHQACKNEVMRF